MPTYDYQCESCQFVFEKRQSFHDEPIAFCPECNSKAKRKISLVPVIFKGNGWYVTDYSKKSSTVTSNGKTEAKPDAAKDSKPVEAKASGDSAAPKAESAPGKKETASSKKES